MEEEHLREGFGAAARCVAGALDAGLGERSGQPEVTTFGGAGGRAGPGGIGCRVTTRRGRAGNRGLRPPVQLGPGSQRREPVQARGQRNKTGDVVLRGEPGARRAQVGDVLVHGRDDAFLVGGAQRAVDGGGGGEHDLGVCSPRSFEATGSAEVSAAHSLDGRQQLVARVALSEPHERLVDERADRRSRLVAFASVLSERLRVSERERPGEHGQLVEQAPFVRGEELVAGLDDPGQAVVAIGRPRPVDQPGMGTDAFVQRAYIDPRDAGGGELDGERQASQRVAQVDDDALGVALGTEARRNRASAVDEELDGRRCIPGHGRQRAES